MVSSETEPRPDKDLDAVDFANLASFAALAKVLMGEA
jgi:hypothetical protein